jgi:hypothetical protein
LSSAVALHAPLFSFTWTAITLGTTGWTALYDRTQPPPISITCGEVRPRVQGRPSWKILFERDARRRRMQINLLVAAVDQIVSKEKRSWIEQPAFRCIGDFPREKLNLCGSGQSCLAPASVRVLGPPVAGDSDGMWLRLNSSSAQQQHGAAHRPR